MLTTYETTSSTEKNDVEIDREKLRSYHVRYGMLHRMYEQMS